MNMNLVRVINIWNNSEYFKTMATIKQSTETCCKASFKVISLWSRRNKRSATTTIQIFNVLAKPLDQQKEISCIWAQQIR